MKYYRYGLEALICHLGNDTSWLDAGIGLYFISTY